MNKAQTWSLAARLENLPLARWHVVLTTICCLGMLFDAFDTFLITPILPKLVAEWKISSVQVGLIASSSVLGMLVGAILFGAMADAIGRLKTFMISILVYAVLTGVCGLANGFTSLLVMRFLVGIGLGGLLPVDASYLSEFVPSRRRGRFLSYYALGNEVGASLAMLVGLTIVVPFQSGWRWAFLVGAVPAILVIFVRKMLPESVRFLVSKDRIPEAVKVVERLEQRVLGNITVPHESAVEAERSSKTAETRVRHRDLFKGGLARTTIMMAVLWLCWVYALFSLRMWFPILLTKELGYTMPAALTLLTIGPIVGITGELTGGYLCDTWGRKPALVCSFLVLVIAGYLLFWLGKDHTMGAAIFILFSVAQGCSGASMYTYTSEIFPTRVRGTGAGFSTSMGRLGGVLGPTVVGVILTKSSLWGILHVNLVLLVLALVVMVIIGQETKKKTLEQIEMVYMRKGA